MSESLSPPPAAGESPRGDLRGFLSHWRPDLFSGFLVFLIALPLCLGIAIASGYPAMAGVFTAIVGAIVTPWISNSELTIKGPAAGLIVIAIGAITELGEVYGPERAYQLALGVGMAAAALQILFALLRTGILGDFFPTSAVHGMLAAIGVIIVAKQLPVALGVKAKGEPLELLRQIPDHFAHMNPAIAAIGFTSLALLFGLPLLKKRLPWTQKIPGPMLVVLVAIPLGLLLDLSHEHTYTLFSTQYQVGESFLVNVPSNILGAVTHPDFGALQSFVGWKWAIMFALIGSLESLLSAKAVDMLDPHARKSNLDRDMLAVGLGNLISASIGGLPMISEIVRSKANIDNGAKTRFANLWHGLFLLGFVALLPALIHRIPLAALSAMLVYTGFRLASPMEFRHVLEIGREQLLVFVGTLVAVLATDLLVGVAIGIAIKFAIHVYNGVPPGALFRSRFDEHEGSDGSRLIKPLQQAVFSNWIPLRRRLSAALDAKQGVVVDLSAAKLVDHTTMDRLHEVQREFDQASLSFEIAGLDEHFGLSGHPLAARKRGLTEIRRLTLVAPAALETELCQAVVGLGATGYTAIYARGAGRTALAEAAEPVEVVRLEFLLPPELSRRALDYLRAEVMPRHSVTACVETVAVASMAAFVSAKEPELAPPSNQSASPVPQPALA